MADAIGTTATVRVDVPLTRPDGGSRDSGVTFRVAGFTASGTVITFRGFLAAYEEGRDAERYESESPAPDKGGAAGGKDVRLPAMSAGDRLRAKFI